MLMLKQNWRKVRNKTDLSQFFFFFHCRNFSLPVLGKLFQKTYFLKISKDILSTSQCLFLVELKLLYHLQIQVLPLQNYFWYFKTNFATLFFQFQPNLFHTDMKINMQCTKHIPFFWQNFSEIFGKARGLLLL